jgi:hypothetical protein
MFLMNLIDLETKWHCALLRAASALLPTPGLDAMLLAGDGVEISRHAPRRTKDDEKDLDAVC